MIFTDPARREQFLAEFVEAARLPESAVAGRAQQLANVLASAKDADFPGAVLPRPRSDRVDYYAVAESGTRWRELKPLLMAFVGITATNFSGLTSELDESDPLEGLMARQDFAAVSRFSANGVPDLETLALGGLLRLREMLHRSGAPRRTVPRSTQQVLREFQLALSGGDRFGAEESIGFLRDNVRLDALNLRALEIQLDATFERWQAIREHPSFPTLVQARRSARLTGALVEALYRTELDEYEHNLDAEGGIAAFRARVLPVSGTLFRIPPPLPRPAVAAAFALAALTQDPPDWNAAAAVDKAALPGTPTELRFREALLARRPRAPTVPSEPAFALEDFQEQLSLANDVSQPASTARALAILLAATELDTLAGYDTAIRYVERLADTQRDEFLQRRSVRVLWETVTAHRPREQKVPQSWTEWLSALPSMDFAQARALADAAVQQWPIRDHLGTASAVQELADGLLSAPEDLVAEAVPFLLEWLRTDADWPNPAHLPILEALFTLLAISARRTPTALSALTQVLDAELLIGLPSNTYRFALTDVEQLVSQALGLRTVDWLLDLLEVLVTHPAPDRTALEGLWDIALGALQPLAARLAPRHREVLTDLAYVLNRDVNALLPPTSAIADIDTGHTDVLVDKLIAIYTLTESVGRRVEQALQAESPKVHVEWLDDHVNSTRLQDLARKADLFVVCWQSAKHAATDAIKQTRPSTRPTFYPTGKGSSSITREVRDFALQLFGASA